MKDAFPWGETLLFVALLAISLLGVLIAAGVVDTRGW